MLSRRELIASQLSQMFRDRRELEGLASILLAAGETDQKRNLNSLADLVGGIQRDQSTSVKEGLATLLAGSGETNEKRNLRTSLADLVGGI